MLSRPFALGSLILPCLMVGGCGNAVPSSPIRSSSLRAPVFDSEFRKTWNDGTAEVSTYDTLRFRAGSIRKGIATVVLRRATYSEDERVPVADSRTQSDVFPAMQMIWTERYSEDLETCQEMTTSVVSLGSVDGRVAGAETKAAFSFQSWDGQLFHQLLFDATGVRSHQYSYLENEGDEQITLSYPRDGIAGDALWFWSRGIAAPVLNSGEQKNVDLLSELRDARSQHHPLVWKTATLRRTAAGTWKNLPAIVFSVVDEGGYSQTFYVETVSPFRVMHWESTTGERADLTNSSRMKSWSGVSETKTH